MTLEAKVAQSLVVRRKTLSVAESCTGGLLANRLTNIPGSSNFLKLGLVTYSNEAKAKILNISSKTIQKHGAVSSQVTIAMAKNIRKKLNTDYGIGISGIAGPAGGTKRKPVGLTFIAVSTQQETLCLECRFQGNRIQIKQQAASQALNLLHEFLDS